MDVRKWEGSAWHPGIRPGYRCHPPPGAPQPPRGQCADPQSGPPGCAFRYSPSVDKTAGEREIEKKKPFAVRTKSETERN